MKSLKYVAITLGALIVLYLAAIFLGFNLPRPSFLEDKGIAGDALLKVTLLMNNDVQNPLSKIEVDLAPNPGPPPKGGIAHTDEDGVATFSVKPGDYYVYFNTINFPKNLAVPREEAVSVSAGKINEKIFLIDTAGTQRP